MYVCKLKRDVTIQTILFLVCRLAELLVAGVVMNEVLQPHEAHVPFVLQFMMDHNLYGMNYIHLSDVKFRIIGLGMLIVVLLRRTYA